MTGRDKRKTRGPVWPWVPFGRFYGRKDVPWDGSLGGHLGGGNRGMDHAVSKGPKRRK